MSNSPPPAANATSKVGDLTTPNTKDKFLPTLCKMFWELKKMRKYTDGVVWDYLWCGFHKIADNKTKDISRVDKVRIIGINVSLCVANIPDSLLARYQYLLKKRGKNPARKCAQEQVIQDINELQETGGNVLSAKRSRKYSSSSWRFPFCGKKPRPPIRPWSLWLVPAQDIHFFYTRSHLSALQNCAVLFSTNF